MKKLEKLTDSQIALMGSVKDEYLGLVFRDRFPINKKKSNDFIDWLYKISNLETPIKIYVNSPLACQFAANLLSNTKINSDQVWDQVSAQVSAQVGNQVRAQVLDQVWDQVGNQVWDQVSAQVSAQVGAQVRDQVGAQVRDQVWDQVSAQVGNQVRAQVLDQVWDQVGNQVWDQVGAQVRDQYFNFAYRGTIYDFDWISFYDFFQRIGIVKHDGFQNLLALKEAGLFYMIQLKGLCIACEMPTELYRDNQNRLHCSDGYAIKWSDGYGFHYLNGVRLPEDLFNKITSKSMSFKEIMQLKNIEQRMIALKYMDANKLLESTNSKLLDKSDRGNELYKISDLFDNDAYFLKYSCPSTGRVYISGIDPDYIKQDCTADGAMAWKHGWSKDVYKQLLIES